MTSIGNPFSDYMGSTHIKELFSLRSEIQNKKNQKKPRFERCYFCRLRIHSQNNTFRSSNILSCHYWCLSLQHLFPNMQGNGDYLLFVMQYCTIPISIRILGDYIL